MKKIFFIAVLAVASLTAYAGPRAIGGRLGAFNGVSYEHAFGESNMLEVEAGYGFAGRIDSWNAAGHARSFGDNIQVAATYDWIDPFGVVFPTMPKGEWHWYMGVGGAAGFGWSGYSFVPGTGYVAGNANWGYLAPAGRVGVEYDFWFPLQLSVDWRPTIGASFFGNPGGGTTAGLYWEVTSLALGVRYKF